METTKTKAIQNKEYMFNFTSGGWNTVWAKTKRSAIAKANEIYTKPDLRPDSKSFRISTEADMKAALSLFH